MRDALRLLRHSNAGALWMLLASAALAGGCAAEVPASDAPSAPTAGKGDIGGRSAVRCILDTYHLVDVEPRGGTVVKVPLNDSDNEREVVEFGTLVDVPAPEEIAPEGIVKVPFRARLELTDGSFPQFKSDVQICNPFLGIMEHRPEIGPQVFYATLSFYRHEALAGDQSRLPDARDQYAFGIQCEAAFRASGEEPELGALDDRESFVFAQEGEEFDEDAFARLVDRATEGNLRCDPPAAEDRDVGDDPDADDADEPGEVPSEDDETPADAEGDEMPADDGVPGDDEMPADDEMPSDEPPADDGDFDEMPAQ